jgi:hypothetical protein
MSCTSGTGTDRQVAVEGERGPLAIKAPSDPRPTELLSELSTHRSDKPVRRFRLVASVAIVLAAVPYGWVLWDLWSGGIAPFRTNGPGSVYDVQARAILHGHLWLPNGSIGLEAFISGRRTYTYFGLFPSLLRIPILLVTHSLDGRLTALSIGASWLVTALFASLLLWRIRVVVRGDAPLGWSETVSYGILLASLLVGSVLVYLASQPNIYSEDLAWSVALCCGSLFALLGVVERPSWGRVVTAGVLVLLTNLNRATTGYACVLGTVLIAAWFALGRAGQERRRWALPVLLAGLVPMAAGCAVDLAKFGLPFGVPASKQLIYKAFEFNRINGGRYFSVRFLPSTLQAYLTPGNLRLSTVFPYLTLPDDPTHNIAHTMLFARSPTASVPASMPLLFGAGIWGVVTTFGRHRPTVFRSLRILLIVAATSAGAVMIFGWILERFVADFMPLLVLASLLGMVDIWQRLDGRRRAARILALVLVGIAALFGFAASLGIAVTPQLGWTQTQVDHYVQAERTLSDLTGHPLGHDVVRGNHFPSSAPMGELFVMDNCKGLYIADKAVPNVFYIPSSIWLPVERAPHTPLCRSLVAGSIRASLRTPNPVLQRGQT